MECRVYVYGGKVKYMECAIDENKLFRPSMFGGLYEFMNKEVIPALKSKYDAFTVDAYIDTHQKWKIVEINSPLWLKAGTYNIDYNWEKHRIHEAETPICRYKDYESGETMEFENIQISL
jgi:hypothetical protein